MSRFFDWRLVGFVAVWALGYAAGAADWPWWGIFIAAFVASAAHSTAWVRGHRADRPRE